MILQHPAEDCRAGDVEETVLYLKKDDKKTEIHRRQKVG
jgi:hypothetical protein